MSEYKTKEGETLDEIAHRFYGSTYDGQVEAVMEANRAMNLGQYVTLPAGMTIVLPTFTAKTQEQIRLFT